ncbi:MAG: 5-oxoprolinase subunit PxpA [Pseudomonadota bacterium]
MQHAILTSRIDLNADLGEGYPHDEALLQRVSSCSIACGGHVGDAVTMRAALRLAKAHNVRVGAHPSFPDRVGFGRRDLQMELADLTESVTAQVAALAEIAAEEGMALSHLKPHGALYHAAAKDPQIADMMVSVTVRVAQAPALYGPPSGSMLAAAQRAGLSYVSEGFADRAYNMDGTLVSRDQAGAVIATDAARAAQAISLAVHGQAYTPNGETVPLKVETICLHGDTDGAVKSASLIREALEADGIGVAPPNV